MDGSLYIQNEEPSIILKCPTEIRNGGEYIVIFINNGNTATEHTRDKLPEDSLIGIASSLTGKVWSRGNTCSFGREYYHIRMLWPVVGVWLDIGSSDIRYLWRSRPFVVKLSTECISVSSVNCKLTFNTCRMFNC